MEKKIEQAVVTKKDNTVPRKSPMGVVYVEINDNNFANAGCYSLERSGQPPLFDIAIIFAANINYDTAQRRAVLFLNENVERVLKNSDTYVKPMQDRGIKVLLSILGNHQGAGVCNFPDQIAARDFATQLAACVAQYNLDGIDFDDEYAKYGNNGTGQPNNFSFIFLLLELRQLLGPDKIISFYYFGPAASKLSYNGMIAGDYLDYSWNAMYGSYDPPKVPGLTREALGPAAVHLLHTDAGTAHNLAKMTVDDGYGIYLYYDLPNHDISTYLSGISSRLYGIGTTIGGNCLKPWLTADVRLSGSLRGRGHAGIFSGAPRKQVIARHD